MEQGQRGLRGGGVDAAGDEVPQDVEQLFVGEGAGPPNSNWRRKLVTSSFGLARLAAACSRTSCIIWGTWEMGVDVFLAVLGDGHDGVEEVGVELPVVVGRPSVSWSGWPGRGWRSRGRSICPSLILWSRKWWAYCSMNGFMFCTAPGEKNGARACRRQVVGPVDLADA